MHALNNAQTYPTQQCRQIREHALSAAAHAGVPAEVKSQVVSQLRHTGNTRRYVLSGNKELICTQIYLITS